MNCVILTSNHYGWSERIVPSQFYTPNGGYRIKISEDILNEHIDNIRQLIQKTIAENNRQ